MEMYYNIYEGVRGVLMDSGGSFLVWFLKKYDVKVRGGFRGGVDRGAQPCWPWSTIIAVNVHHYKYSTLKREIKRRLDTVA